MSEFLKLTTTVVQVFAANPYYGILMGALILVGFAMYVVLKVVECTVGNKK